MMNKIFQLFQTKQNILSIYFPAGYPKPEDTIKNVRMLIEKGIDMIEIGIPFSDPLVDGPVIQNASQKALENGMNLNLVFEQLSSFDNNTQTPILLMGYWNTVYQYGVEKFVCQCRRAGVSGVILPDLPLEEYLENYKTIFEKNDLLNIFLVSPNISYERLQKIAVHAQGFIYVVSMPSVTGGEKMLLTSKQEQYFLKVASFGTPTMIGFGITDQQTFKNACRFANGAIVGSAFIRALKKNRAESFLENFY